MKIKFIISAFLFAIFSILLISQVKLVQAGGSPSNPPFVPISLPNFGVRGNVSLKVLNRLIPMSNVSVEISYRSQNYIGSFVTHVTTDFAGNYSLFGLPAGNYQVRPIPIDGSVIFSPPRRYFRLDRDIDNVSFWGILRPRGRG